MLLDCALCEREVDVLAKRIEETGTRLEQVCWAGAVTGDGDVECLQELGVEDATFPISCRVNQAFFGDVQPGIERCYGGKSVKVCLLRLLYFLR